VNIQIKIFGQLVEVVGCADLEWEYTQDTDSLRKSLHSGFPKLEGFPYVLAIDKKIAVSNQKIKEGDIIALLPPFSGG